MKVQRKFGWACAFIAGIFIGVAALSAAPAPAPAPRTEETAITPAPHSTKRHLAILASLKGLDPQVAFLGDSITDFWQTHGADVWKSYVEKYHAADLGISGDCTENVLWRITTGGELNTIHPKVMIVMIGTNNIGHTDADKPEWAAAGVKKIIERVQSKLPETKILLLAVFPRNAKDSPQRIAVAGINDIIKTYADGEKVRYLDIGSVFLDADGAIPTDVMKDGLHPTEKGYELWRDAMQPTLDEMLK